MKIGRLHILTDTVIQSRFDHVELAERAIRGGADTIQYRRKSGSTAEMILEAKRVRAICKKGGVPLIVNDRIDVAIAADADGVHLGRNDFPIRLARQILGPHRIIGASAGSIEEARAGYAEGADYMGCGPIHATGTKPDAGPAAGADLVTMIAKAVPLPLIAIGGITEADVDLLFSAGTHGIAVISAVCASADPEAAVRALRRRIDARIGGAA